MIHYDESHALVSFLKFDCNQHGQDARVTNEV